MKLTYTDGSGSHVVSGVTSILSENDTAALTNVTLGPSHQPAGSDNLLNYTYIDKETAIPAGTKVVGFDVYCAAVATTYPGLWKPEGAQKYSSRAREMFAHPGGGWKRFILAAAYVTTEINYPGAFMGWSASGVAVCLATSYAAGNASGNGVQFTDHTGAINTPGLRVVIEGPPKVAFITLGQSNSGNVHGPGLYTVRHPDKLKMMDFQTGNVVTGTDPLPGIGPGWTGGPWGDWAAEFGDLMVDTGRYSEVLIAPIGGVPGPSSDWAVGGMLNPRIAQVASRLIALGYTVKAVLVMHGETNAQLGAATFQADWQSAIDTFRASSIIAPVYIARETHSSVATPYAEAVRAAQIALVNGVDVFTGPDFDLYGDDMRHDNVHFNAVGRGLVAHDWAVIAP